MPLSVFCGRRTRSMSSTFNNEEASRLASSIAASFVVPESLPQPQQDYGHKYDGGEHCASVSSSKVSSTGNGSSDPHQMLAAVVASPDVMSPDFLSSVRKLVWPPDLPEEDIKRWHGEGFVFSQEETTRAGLRQSRGGPCGVFAAVQAFLLKELLFSDDAIRQREEGSSEGHKKNPLLVSDDLREEALVHSLAAILWQCRPSDCSPASLVTCPPGPTTIATLAEHFSVHSSIASVTQMEQLIKEFMPSFRSETGVVLFMFSLVATRTIEVIKQDMDDPSNSLTVQFGHCAQELVNLLLCGYASSQVHDGQIPMGDTGLVLRGVSDTPEIGYLSLLEALRYCTVGEYYKTPKYPVWLVASESHFSVLFSSERKLVLDSPEEMAAKILKRSFAKQDAGGGGFVPVHSLELVLQDLKLIEAVIPSSTTGAIERLRCFLDSQSMGIILWQDFLTTMTPVITGACQIVDWEKSTSAHSTNASSSAAMTEGREVHGQGGKGWACAACTFVNDSSKDTCDVCLSSRPKAERLPTVPSTAAVQGDSKRQRVKDSSDGHASTEEADFASGFELFHYNGLEGVVNGKPRGAMLTKCHAFKRVDIVGVARGLQGFGINNVIQTKWPGCEIEWVDGKVGNVNG